MEKLFDEMVREVARAQKRFLYEINADLGFKKPREVIFWTGGLKDQDPVKWQTTDFGYKATAKTLGLEKVKIEICDDEIKISGKNIIDDTEFGTTLPLPLKEGILGQIKEIKHKTVAGVTIVELHLDRLEQRIKITEME